MVEAAYPEAVQRRRAEAVSALATAELQELVSSDTPAESHQALVQVCCAPKLRCPLTTCNVCERQGTAKLTQAVGGSGQAREC